MCTSFTKSNESCSIGGCQPFCSCFQDLIFWTSIITSNLRNSHADSSWSKYSLFAINNDNRNEWSPIRSVIIRVINKIGRPRSGSPICLITSMITNQIGRHKVLLPINHSHYNFREIKCIPLLISKEMHHKFIHFGKSQFGRVSG